MKNLLILFILVALTSIPAYSQFDAQQDGNINISNTNGNLDYVYPISRTTRDGHPLEVSVNYLGNVQMTAFYYYLKDDQTGENNFLKLTKMQPAWVLNVNGFAVDVFGRNFNWFDAKKLPTSTQDGFKRKHVVETTTQNPDVIGTPDESLQWLIEGYDFCNNMIELNSEFKQSTSTIGRDEIKILMADGSILKLTNVNNNSFNNYQDLRHYTGTYNVNSSQLNGFAEVEYDTTSHWPEYVTQYIPYGDKRNLFKPRIVKLYLGDGLEYIFKEWITPYGARSLSKVFESETIDYGAPTDSPDISLASVSPTVFYLEEINSSLKNLTKFKRDRQNFSDSKTDVSRGRGRVIEFSGHKINYGDWNIQIESLGRLYNFNFLLKPNSWKYQDSDEFLGYKLDRYQDTVSKYNYKDEYLTSPINLNQQIGDVNSAWDVWGDPEREQNQSYDSDYFGKVFTGMPSSGYHIFFDKIIDPEGREVKFKYDFKLKQFLEKGTTIDQAWYFTNTLRISEISLPDKIVEFNYQDDVGQSSGDPLSMGSNINFSKVSPDTLFEDDESLHTNFINSIKDVTYFEKVNYDKGAGILKTEYEFINKYSLMNSYLIEFRSNSYHGTMKQYGNATIWTERKVVSEKDLKSYWCILEQEQITYKSDKMRFANITTTDLKTGNFIYNQYEYEVVNDTYEFFIWYLQNQQAYVSNHKYFNVKKSSTKFNHKSDSLKTGDVLTLYDYYDQGSASNPTDKPVRLLKATKTYMQPSDLDKPIQVSLNEFEYEFEEINFNSDAKDSLLKSKTHSIYYSDVTDQLYRKVKYNYKNLELDYETITVSDSIVDVMQTKLSNRKKLDLGGTGTKTIFNISNISNELKTLPPIFGLTESVLAYDSNDDIIGGIKFNWAEDQATNTPTYKRGVLVSDTIIGKNGITKLGNIYSYRGGYNRNFLNNITNRLGATSSLYYDYNDIGGVPSGKVMQNTENTYMKKLTVMNPEFESPIANETNVRKYNHLGHLTTESWKTIVEKSEFGGSSAIIDPNGYYSEMLHDKNGRITKVRLPYDFPDNSNNYPGGDCVNFDTLKTKKYKKVDRISINYDYIDPSEWILEKDLLNMLVVGSKHSMFSSSFFKWNIYSRFFY